MTTPIISFKNFSFRYKTQQAPTLKHINLNIYPGEKVLILGPSGSGKSTLGKCLNGLIPNHDQGEFSGTAVVNGKPVAQASIFQRSRDVGTVLQDSDAQFVGLSVGEDISFYLENLATPLAEMKMATKRAATQVDIDHFLDHLPFNLSGGQKQRTSIAGVLQGQAPILLFDEPLAALNPNMSHSIIDLIDRLNREAQKTVVIIEHRLEEVLYRHVDRIILLKAGKIVATGTPDELLRGDQLEQCGIRRPLYLEYLQKISDHPLPPTGLANLDDIDLRPYQDDVRHFLQRHPAPSVSASSSTKPVIELKDLLYSYDGQHAVTNIDHLAIHPGERISIVGQNGAGKSTLAKLLTGVLRPTAGEIIENGQTIAQQSIQEIGQHVGYIMQDPNKMIVEDTVADEAGLALHLRGVAPDQVQQRVAAALKVTDLYTMRHWPVNALSFGQKRRLNIASVLVLHPSCLILDEPTAGQDYYHYRRVMDFIADFAQRAHITLLVITHDMQLTLEYTDRTLVVDDGHVIADDQPARILANAALVSRAGLAQTSIYRLADRLHVNGAQLAQATSEL